MKFVMNVDLACTDGVVRTVGQDVPASCVSDYMLLNGLVTAVEEQVVEEQVVEEQVVEEQVLTEVSEPVEVEVEEPKSTRKKGRGRR